MSAKNPYSRIATKPLPRADLAPPESAPREEEGTPTLVRCPVCLGGGLLRHEEAAAIERLMTDEAERR